MKKLIALMLVVFAVFALCACGGTDDEQAEGKATVVVYSSEPTKYTVDLSELEGEKTVLAAMEYLNEKKGVALTYSTSEYGAYVTEFDVLKEDKEKFEYVYFWTSVQSDWDVSAYASENAYAGVKLVSSGLGVSSATLTDGAVVMFAYYGTSGVSLDAIETATIVVHGETDEEYVLDLTAFKTSPTVFDAMEYLNENKGVALTYSTSEYGAYVTEFASLKSDPLSGKYIGFHTSVKKDWDISATATEKYYMGTRLITSGVGVSSAAIVDEAIIYFDYIIYSF